MSRSTPGTVFKGLGVAAAELVVMATHLGAVLCSACLEHGDEWVARGVGAVSASAPAVATALGWQGPAESDSVTGLSEGPRLTPADGHAPAWYVEAPDGLIAGHPGRSQTHGSSPSEVAIVLETIDLPFGGGVPAHLDLKAAAPIVERARDIQVCSVLRTAEVDACRDRVQRVLAEVQVFRDTAAAEEARRLAVTAQEGARPEDRSGAVFMRCTP